MKYYHFYPKQNDELADVMNMIYKFLVEKHPDVKIGRDNLEEVYDLYVGLQKDMLMNAGYDYILKKSERLLKKVRNFDYLIHFVDRFDRYSRFSPEKMVYTCVAALAPSLQGEYKVEQAKLVATVERYINNGGNDAFIRNVIEHYLIRLCNKQKIDMAEPIEKIEGKKYYSLYNDLMTLKNSLSAYKEGPVQLFWQSENGGVDENNITSLMHSSDPKMLREILKDEIEGLHEACRYWLCKGDCRKEINTKVSQAKRALEFINRSDERQ